MSTTGEICVLVGPSGCGKTTTLRMINRLIEPTSGRIFLDGDDVTKIDPVELRRHIGYVIQQIGLFPHQTIGTNIATVPRLLGWPKQKVRGTGRRVARPDRARSGRVPRSLSEPAVRRATAARRRGPCARRRSGRAADGRAVRRHRPDQPRAVAGRVPAAASRSEEDRRVRDPRHRRGSQARRPHRHPPRRRLSRAVRLAWRGTRQSGRRLRRRLRRRRPRPEAAEGHVDRSDRPRPTAGASVRPRSRGALGSDSMPTSRSSRSFSTTTVDCAGYLQRERADGDGRWPTGCNGSKRGCGCPTRSRTLSEKCCCTTPGWVAVLDDDDRFLGVLTPEALYAATRRTIEEHRD